MIFTAKNSRFNRESNILDKIILLIENKNGLSYFALLNSKETNIYCYCETSLFDKEFVIIENSDIPKEIQLQVNQALDLKKPTYLRYPMDLKKLKKD
jgi:hypothetical protein